MRNGKNEKNTLCAVSDEELSSVSGGAKNTAKEVEAVGYLRALGAVAGGDKTPAGVFFNAAANKLQDLSVLYS
jgi:hypothetical protein